MPKAMGTSLPAPTGGLNTRDNLAAMAQTDATEFTNWFATPDKVAIRAGYDKFTVGPADYASSMYEFNSGGTRELISAEGGVLRKTTTGGTTSTLSTGYSGDDWIATHMNSRLYMVNGEDTPIYYDGTSVSSAGFSGSGLTPADLSVVVSYSERLFFIEKNTQSVWYSPAKLSTNVLVEFPLQYVSNFGGSLISLGTFSVSSGDGIDDYIAFFFESGDVVVYQGTNPGDSAAWRRVAQLSTSPILGKRAVFQYGSDLLVITRDGIYPMSRLVTNERIEAAYAISDKIRPTFKNAAKQYANNAGWQGVYYPNGSKIIINVPRSPSTNVYDQFVMNTINGSWAVWEDIPAKTWATFNNKIYFSGYHDGGAIWNQAIWDEAYWTYYGIFEGDTGNNDNGNKITGTVKQAYSPLGRPGQNKLLGTVTHHMRIDAEFTTIIGFSKDFNPTYQESSLGSDGQQGAIWDEAIWDEAIWQPSQLQVNQTQTLNGNVKYVSFSIETSSRNQDVEWYATDMNFQVGGLI